MTKKKPSKRSGAHSDAEFEELDTLARTTTIESLRPLSPKNRRLWQRATRGRGRPRKSSADRSVPVQVTLEPLLLQEVDHLADQTGKSRSQLIAEGLRSILRRERRKAS
jgi:hypothetical protein